jgi:hypothetical protein
MHLTVTLIRCNNIAQVEIHLSYMQRVFSPILDSRNPRNPRKLPMSRFNE